MRIPFIIDLEQHPFAILNRQAHLIGTDIIANGPEPVHVQQVIHRNLALMLHLNSTAHDAFLVQRQGNDLIGRVVEISVAHRRYSL
jgi:hypothetical protein